MATPDEPRRRPGGRPPTGGPSVHPARAAVLLVLFVVLTVVFVRQVHPTAVTSTPAAPQAAATTTTAPHPTTTTTTAPPTNVPVLVANGSSASGAAGDLSNQLRAAGWSVLPAVNATISVARSTVYYASGQQAPARAIASSLHLPASAVQPLTSSAPVAATGGADVVVVIGADIGQTVTTTSTTAG
ncbi:MAG: LytR C-terminal domain-containing protein [Actinomycetota bacterium]|nr:LytR C-terminal domain-containing protein [Actinomycetota bacterium]